MEWALQQVIYDKIVDRMGKSDIDLFASKQNNKVNTFITYVPEKGAISVNAFSVIWNYKNSAEVDIAPAFGEITTACNVGQAKKGHGACLKSGQLVYARFHTHSHRCCREMYYNSRLDVNFLDSTQNIDKVSGA